MPEVTYATTLNLPVETIWDFIQDMNNWAPMLTGYQEHEIKTDRQSIWTLKGDVGILSRKVRLEVNITEWQGPNRVSFTLTGLNEVVEGDGTFEMRSMAPAGGGGASVNATTAVVPVRPWLGRRLLNWLFRVIFRSMHDVVEREAPQVQAGTQASHLSFRLRMDAGGPTGPLVNAMLEPALLPAAEDLGNKIALHLEKVHAATGPKN